MANDRKGYKVPATVIPGHDSFPVVDSNDVAGNLMYFDTVEQLVTIPKDKRKLGMFAYVNTEGKHYKLVDNKDVLDAACWEPYELVSKEYVDNAISNAGGSATPVDAYTKAESDNKYALKTEIPTVPDISGLETAIQELSQLVNNTPKIQSNEFTVNQNSLPYTTEWEVPTTGPIILEVTKEIEENIQTTEVEEVNPVEFNSSNANLVSINSNEYYPAYVVVDDNGIRMEDAYVDTPIDLQMFGNPLPTPVQGSPVSFKTQLIVTDCKFTFDNLNDLEGLSVTGSVGSNNFVGLVIRPHEYEGSDFGTGIGYDFDEGKWFAGVSDYYNMASWSNIKQSQSFDTDFSTTVMNEYSPQVTNYDFDTYVIGSIPINKLKDIPAAKWQELFDPNGTIDLSSTSFERNGGTLSPLDKSKVQICFIFAVMDESQPCRVTKLAMKKTSTTTTTTTKNIPALTPEDFTYDITKGTGKSAVRFEWSGWKVGMTGKIYCENLYFPISE